MFAWSLLRKIEEACVSLYLLSLRALDGDRGIVVYRNLDFHIRSLRYIAEADGRAVPLYRDRLPGGRAFHRTAEKTGSRIVQYSARIINAEIQSGLEADQSVLICRIPLTERPENRH